MTQDVRVPGAVWWAVGLTGFHVLMLSIGFFTTLTSGRLGWAVLNLTVAGILAFSAIALARLEEWARVVVVSFAVLSWLLTLAAGRFDLISTNIAVVVLLLVPSSQAAFEQSKMTSGTDIPSNEDRLPGDGTSGGSSAG